MKNRKMKKKVVDDAGADTALRSCRLQFGKRGGGCVGGSSGNRAEAETPKEQEPAGEAKDLSSLTIGLANINERGRVRQTGEAGL